MVDINLTLLVQAGLFLVFLWAMNAFVFRPLLNRMDERDDQVQGDRRTAEEAAAQAAQLERQYASESASIHREASREVVRAHRKVQEAHLKRVAEVKERGDSELAAVRQEVSAAIAAEKAQYDELAQDLAHAMARTLGVNRNGA